MMKRVCAVLAIGLAMLIPSAAVAADGYQEASSYSGSGNAYCTAHLYDSTNYDSRGCFQPEGDNILVVDGEGDGYGVAVQWKTSSGRAGVCHWGGGNGTVGVCNKDFPETTTVSWRVGRCKKTSSVDCKSFTSQYTGISAWQSKSAGASNP